MSSYPVNLELTGQRVLVVGGGHVAARKVAGLLRAGAVVTVVAPDAVTDLADDPDVRWHQREYRRGEAASYRLVLTATDNATVNAQVARDCRAANVFVNSADDPANCTFTLPAVVQRGHLQLAVSTNGRSPAFSAWVRERLQGQYTDTHARLLDLLGEVRDEARSRLGTSELPGWAEVLDDDLLDAVGAGRDDEVRARVRAALGLADTAEEATT
jgi:precorrin-2 dehydrogenase/sirohydrochlorin ferrochelatase